MEYQELTDTSKHPGQTNTNYTQGQNEQSLMDDPNYMPPELLKMQEPESGLVFTSIDE